MPSIEFEIYCERGNLLNCKTNMSGDIEAEPCEKCLETAREEGRDEDYNERDKEE